MTAYYNEIDPYAAEWLRNLISAGHIAAGEVDERSITDVRSDDLRGFTQCHFFAGIGGWSYALRLAGWPDDRPVWTGSCPCQPFSAAGKQRGLADERHLWPIWFDLIRECGPAVVFGEQVEAAIGHGWLDAVFSDLEGEGYACGAAGVPACSVEAPHIRQRLWFVANALQSGRSQWRPGSGHGSTARSGSFDLVAHTTGERRYRKQGTSWSTGRCRAEDRSVLGDTIGSGLEGHARDGGPAGREGPPRSVAEASLPGRLGNITGRRPWSNPEWLPCRDGKARPTQPGLLPLAHGVPGRVGRLRAYGNAIVPQVAAEFIGAWIDLTLTNEGGAT